MSKNRIEGDASELYQLLDDTAKAITNSKICELLNWGEERLHAAKKSLLRAQSIYVTQEGVILQKYATTDQQIWHLGWCLGLFVNAGNHLTMDKDLLLEAPKVFKQLIDDGKFDKANKLLEFRQRVIESMELPKRLLSVYQQVDKIVEDEIKLLEATNELRNRYKKQ
jgi:hypothetical protein